MNKILILIAVLLSQITNAQYVTFSMDSINGKLNGKEMHLISKTIQTNITDTSDIIIVGYNDNNDKLGVKYYLTKIVTTEGTSYLPALKFIYSGRDGILKNIPIPEPNYNHPLTKTDSTQNMIVESSSYRSGRTHHEFSYHCFIDGSKLSYTDITNPQIKPATIELSIARLSMEGSVALKNKKFIIEESTKFQTIEIDRYHNQPVFLTYRMLRAKTGLKENILFASSLQYINKNGKQDSISFIEDKSLTNTKIQTVEISGSGNDENSKIKIKCKYKLHYVKREE